MSKGLSSDKTARRDFLKAAVSVAAVGGTSGILSGRAKGSAGSGWLGSEPLIRRDSVILFQGDSITDAGRDRNSQASANNGRALGTGYAFLAACQLLGEHGEKNLKIHNRGISGNKVFQLAERWEKDCLELKPDVVSILIGVNDIWHKLNGNYDGTLEKYEKDYDALLARTKQELPKVKLVICEPFVLRCGAVNEKWFPEFDGFRAAAKKMAEKYKAVFVPFQRVFDQAVKKAPPQYWAGDGVHPSLAGAYLMAQAWIKTVV